MLTENPLEPSLHCKSLTHLVMTERVAVSVLLLSWGSYTDKNLVNKHWYVSLLLLLQWQPSWRDYLGRRFHSGCDNRAPHKRWWYKGPRAGLGGKRAIGKCFWRKGGSTSIFFVSPFLRDTTLLAYRLVLVLSWRWRSVPFIPHMLPLLAPYPCPNFLSWPSLQCDVCPCHRPAQVTGEQMHLKSLRSGAWAVAQGVRHLPCPH